MFFTKLKELCEQHKTNPTRVCQELGIPKTTVSYWRNTPDFVPKASALKKLATYFDVPTDYFLDDEAQPTVDTSKLYKKISDLCNSRGVTVTQMCKEADVKRSCLSELNAGRTKNLSCVNLVKIADYFSVSIEELNGRTQLTDEVSSYLEELRNRPEMRMLFSVSAGATKAEIEQAVKIIEALKKNG